HADPERDILSERPESVESGRVITRGPEPKRELGRIRPPPEEILAAYLPPMRAVLVRATHASAEEGWFEPKYDGFRALAPDPLRLSEVHRLPPAEALRLAKPRGWEGVVQKDPVSAWVGARHPAWKKIKLERSE